MFALNQLSSALLLYVPLSLPLLLFFFSFLSITCCCW